jgi:hypothetical protein
MIKNYFIILLTILCLNSKTFSQEKDFQIWTEFEAEAGLGKNFSFCLENETRFYENASIFGRNKTDLGFGYDINKVFSVGASYRMLYYYPLTEFVYSKNKWVINGYFKPRYKRWRFNLRFRLSNDDETHSSLLTNISNHRERFQVKYNFRKSPFRAVFGTETYFPFSHNPFMIEKLRTYAGIEIKLSDNHKFGIDYLIDKDFNTNNALTAYILQFNYSYNIGRILED